MVVPCVAGSSEWLARPAGAPVASRGRETETEVAWDNFRWSWVQMAPAAAQPVVSGRVTVTAPFPRGLEVWLPGRASPRRHGRRAATPCMFAFWRVGAEVPGLGTSRSAFAFESHQSLECCFLLAHCRFGVFTVDNHMCHIPLRMIIMADLLVIHLYGNILMGYPQVKRAVGGTDPSLWNR